MIKDILKKKKKDILKNNNHICFRTHRRKIAFPEFIASTQNFTLRLPHSQSPHDAI